MFYKNGLTTKGKEVFEVIWKNNNLRESLFGEIDINDKKEKIEIEKDFVRLVV